LGEGGLKGIEKVGGQEHVQHFMDSSLCVEIMDMDPQYVYAFSSYTEFTEDG
jgi:hypothetical protein